MRSSRPLFAATALVALVAGAAAAPLGGQPANVPPPSKFSANHGLPVIRQCRYTLTGRIRPLLFWVGRDNVGEARIGWLQGGPRRGYDLLIGSDPAKAPRAINRWGYIAEAEDGVGLHVVGLMTEADAESLEQAKTTAGEPQSGMRVFKAIQSTVAPEASRAKTFGLTLSDRLTLHDLDVVLDQVPPLPAEAPPMRLAPGTVPGFLFAMASLIHESVDVCQRTGKVPVGVRRSYVYGNKMYDVVARASRLEKRVVVEGHEYRNVIETEFHAQKRGGSGGSLYRITYGTDGPLREVPLRIVYRPKWWFEAELKLTEMKP